MKKYVDLKHDVVYNKKISENVIAVYAAICLESSNDDCEVYVSPDTIIYSLCGNTNVSRRSRDMVVAGIKEVVELGLVEVVCNIKKNVYVCKPVFTEYGKGDYYIRVTLEEIRKIFNSKGNKNNFSLFVYFLVLIGSFNGSKKISQNYRFKVGTMSNVWFQNNTNLSGVSIVKYDKILQSEKLIYSRRTFVENKECNAPKQKSKTYSRYKDMDLCNEYAEKVRNAFPVYGKNRVNESRKYVQMYNYLVKGKEYNKKTIKKIHQEMVAWNSRKRSQYEHMVEMGYTPEEPIYKDLSFFDQYDFIGDKPMQK